MAEGVIPILTFGQRRHTIEWRHMFLRPPYKSRWHQLRRCRGFGATKRLIQRYMKVASRRHRLFKWTEHKLMTRELLTIPYTLEDAQCSPTSGLSTSSESGPG
jgi:hypothetical protein